MRTCERGHLMVPIMGNQLELCECSSRGWLSNLRGAVEEAQRLVERGGGLEALRSHLLEQEAERKQERKERRAEQAEALRSSIRRLNQ